MSDHASLAPSAAHRWMQCPGCVAIEKRQPEIESDHALEGTVAHEIADKCLRLFKVADSFIGRKIKDVEVTWEMSEAVQVYLDYVRDRMDKGDCRKVSSEIQVKLNADVWGTIDCLVEYKDNDLHVIDYKHGQGVVVEPKLNPQLMIYALAAYRKCHSRANVISMTIVQPRAPHDKGSIRTWRVKAEALEKWYEKKLKPAIENTKLERAWYRVGDHCRFCKALAVCEAQAKNAVSIAKTDFAKPVLPAPEGMSVETLADVFEKSKMFSAWAKAVETRIHHLLASGVKIPGHKLVHRRANRKWADENGPTSDSLETIFGEDAYTKKLISVAQAEKLLKRLGLDASYVEDLWIKPKAGTTVAAESDKRPAVDALADFKKGNKLLN